MAFLVSLTMRRSLVRHVRLSFFSSSSSSCDNHLPTHQRVWTPSNSTSNEPQYWTESIQAKDRESMDNLIGRIESQERKGGRMQQRKLGVLSEDPVEDMRLLIQNYTVPSLASALRDREDVLQYCAELASQQKWEELAATLEPFEHQYVLQRRSIDHRFNIAQVLNDESLEQIRKILMRMPRRVTQAHQKRAGVVLPLCNVDGVPCLLLEKRSPHLRAHPDEVCLPGGMICTKSDQSIVATCLREMREEIGGISQYIQVLGVLRCNWGQVHHLVGVAVTPVVCFLGEIGAQELRPNDDEVAECFTVPLESFLDKKAWIYREGYAPIFIGGPHVIWGLTGYICRRFAKDVLASQ